jgi:hypothetical protein
MKRSGMRDRRPRIALRFIRATFLDQASDAGLMWVGSMKFCTVTPCLNAARFID